MSDDDVKAAVTDAILRILTELAPMLRKADIGVGEFSAIARAACVRAALREVGTAKPNVSRISSWTGMSREQVKALLTQPPGTLLPVRRGRPRTTRVLEGWHTADYVDASTGEPLRLKMRGRGRTFAKLVKDFGGQDNPVPILDELVQAGAVRVHDDGMLEALSRNCAAQGYDAEHIASLGLELANHAQTAVYNLEHPHEPRFSGVVRCARLNFDRARVVIPDAKEDAHVFLESLGTTFEQPDNLAESERELRRAIDVSVGIYFSQSPADPSEQTEAAKLPDRNPRRGKRRRQHPVREHREDG